MCVFNRPRRADSSVSQSVSCPTVIEAGWQARQATTKKKKKRRRSRLTRFRTGRKRRRSGQLIAAVVEVGHFLRLHCKGTFFSIVFAPSHSPLHLISYLGHWRWWYHSWLLFSSLQFFSFSHSLFVSVIVVGSGAEKAGEGPGVGIESTFPL